MVQSLHEYITRSGVVRSHYKSASFPTTSSDSVQTDGHPERQAGTCATLRPCLLSKESTTKDVADHRYLPEIHAGTVKATRIR